MENGRALSRSLSRALSLALSLSLGTPRVPDTDNQLITPKNTDNVGNRLINVSPKDRIEYGISPVLVLKPGRATEYPTPKCPQTTATTIKPKQHAWTIPKAAPMTPQPPFLSPVPPVTGVELQSLLNAADYINRSMGRQAHSAPTPQKKHSFLIRPNDRLNRAHPQP